MWLWLLRLSGVDGEAHHVSTKKSHSLRKKVRDRDESRTNLHNGDSDGDAFGETDRSTVVPRESHQEVQHRHQVFGMDGWTIIKSRNTVEFQFLILPVRWKKKGIGKFTFDCPFSVMVRRMHLQYPVRLVQNHFQFLLLSFFRLSHFRDLHFNVFQFFCAIKMQETFMTIPTLSLCWVELTKLSLCDIWSLDWLIWSPFSAKFHLHNTYRSTFAALDHRKDLPPAAAWQWCDEQRVRHWSSQSKPGNGGI